jgi:hypothetical protein
VGWGGVGWWWCVFMRVERPMGGWCAEWVECRRRAWLCCVSQWLALRCGAAPCTHGARRFVFVDTPGQIEVFTWSASGSIITDMLAAKHPTCIVYVVDTPRAANPTTFMANMLYACR